MPKQISPNGNNYTSIIMKMKKSHLYWYLKRKCRKANCRNGGYSQYGQDLAVLDLLENISSGVFIDIGANDGLTFSNSLLFEEKGWQGICVEPHPLIFEELKKQRGCQCVNACIADHDSSVDFLAVNGPAHMLSGIEDFMDQGHKIRIDKEIQERGGSKQRIRVETLSPRTLIERYSISQIDFLSVDTEGCELPILRSFLSDSKSPKPKVISVENGSRTSSLFDYLTSVGYILHKCVGCDEVYYRN